MMHGLLYLGKRRIVALVVTAVTMGAAALVHAGIEEGLVNYWNFDDGSLEDLAPEGESYDELNFFCSADPDDFSCIGETFNFSDLTPFTGQSVTMSGGEADGHVFAESSADVLGAEGDGGYLDGNMAISLWAQTDSLDFGWQALLAHGEQEGYRLHRRGSESVAAFTGNSSGDTDGATIDIGPGTGWHHYAAIVEDNVASLYVDGQFQGTEAPGTPVDQGTGVHIGYNPETSGREWQGQIDDVGMWKRPLSEGEIYEIYNKGLSGFSLLETDDAGPFIPTGISGPAGSDGRWGVREITNNGEIDGVRAAATSTEGGGTITDGSFAILDVTDPDTNPDGGPILGGTPNALLSNTAGDDDNITTVAKGRIEVKQAGDYTFNVNADNGFALRIVGKDLSDASAGAVIDPNDSTTFARLTPGGGLATANLEAGEYDIEVLSWSGTGDARYEVTSAQGVITDPALAQWIAVGDPTAKEGFSKPPTVILSGPAAVFGMPGVDNCADDQRGEPTCGIGLARQNYADGNIDAVGESEVIALYDPDSNDDFGGLATPFPGGADGTNEDNFTTAVEGAFDVNDGDDIPGEQIRLTFSLQSDDNSQLRIIGSSFDTTNQQLIDVDGDMACTGDFNSGNVNTTCSITLEEGTHEFQAFQREQGGGAFLQVHWAEGEVAAFSSADFSILSTNDTPTDIPANQGLALVGGGGQAASCDFDLNGSCDVDDLDNLAAVIAAGSNDAAFDMTGDGTVDQADQNAWHVATDTLPGDANLDGIANAQDLNALGNNWQQDVSTWANGDFNGDGRANATDLNTLGGNWQKTSAQWQSGLAAAAPAAVPEPASLTMLLAGLFGLFGLRRRG